MKIKKKKKIRSKKKKKLTYLEMSQMPGIHGAKNLDSKYLYVSKESAENCGFTSSYCMEREITDYDLRCKAVELADTFVERDKFVISNLETLKMIDFCCYSDNKWLFLLSEKFPMYKNNKVCGVMYKSTDITNTSLRRFFLSTIYLEKRFKRNEQFSYILKDNIDELLFTKRESECLYFIIRGKPCKEVGAILKIDRRTVEDHVEKLKEKFECNKKSELIEKALSLGYLSVIPESILNLY